MPEQPALGLALPGRPDFLRLALVHMVCIKGRVNLQDARRSHAVPCPPDAHLFTFHEIKSLVAKH